MITEELKYILDSLPSGVHEQAREMVIPYRTEELRPYLRYPTKIPGQNTSLIRAVTKMITLYT